jgi:hypothetical protein
VCAVFHDEKKLRLRDGGQTLLGPFFEMYLMEKSKTEGVFEEGRVDGGYCGRMPD